MCSIQAAMAGVQIVGKVQEYREKKALAASKRRADAITIENANRAYIRDINKIDQEKVQADQEKTVAKVKTDMEKKKKIAQNINLNAGNSVAIVQDIGSLYNDEYNENARDFKGDMITLANQTTDAYANMAKVYNSIVPVVEPSRTGLLLDIATTAGEGYVAHTDAMKAEKG
jgi:hypothetical protein|tara:strand:- start:745 stop:1260 length:516 start_codon:yes stop_codon:yes gene_type:complete